MITTDPINGLTPQQAEEAAARGESNGSQNVHTKSVWQIVRENLFTLFNLLNIVLAALVAFTGSWRNMLFMGVVISNTAIGIFQELRSKRVIDRLSVLSAPKARLLRGGRELSLPVADIVKGDIMLLSAGQQVCADGEIAEGFCEADESLVTGESDPVPKNVGDELLSGSFIVAGSVKAQAARVGSESFSGQITGKAKGAVKRTSEMMRSINRIISIVSVCIVPFGAVLFLKAFLVTRQSLESGIVSTVAALIGMIPEGLVLLTSIALAVSTIRLAQKDTLCQDLYCVEALARVDTLCLDKTGTLTEGCMELSEVVSLCGGYDAQGALAAFAGAFTDPNATLKAIAESFPASGAQKPLRTVPLSSARKWSAAEFEDFGCLFLGAPSFVLDAAAYSAIEPRVRRYAENGQRVLLLAQGERLPENGEAPRAQAKALVVLSDKIRPSTPQTLEYFKRQGVALKIISGDDPVTVSNVARRAGLEGAERCVDVSALTDAELEEAAEKYTVFGRVQPFRKLALVKALKARGHKVAMTGDGVNDVPALREADCSIAMQSGSDAARCVSQLVLLTSDLGCLPLVVAEGRRTINNIQRSAALFLVKTIYAFLLAAAFLVLPLAYPFKPIQMTLISALTIGVPSFLLALEPNRSLVRGGFLANVLRRAAPGGITAALGVGLVMAAQQVLAISAEHTSVMAVYLTAAVSFAVLFGVCLPFNAARGVMFAALTAAFVGAAALFGGLFYLEPLSAVEWVALAALVGASWLILAGLNALAVRLYDKRAKKSA